MAMIDYGAIAFKNGKLISTGMFTPMKEMVGWQDNSKYTYHVYHADKDVPLGLKGNYFAYIGDKEKTVAFYKECMVSYEKYGKKASDYFKEEEWFGSSKYHWNKWTDGIKLSKRYLRKHPKATRDYMKVTKRNGYYVCKWWYKNDFYKVYFGYGVDYSLYKKTKLTHFVNYFRLPQHAVRSLRRDIHNNIEDWWNSHFGGKA